MSQIFDITLGRWRPLTTADLAGGGGGNGGTSVTNLTATVSPTSVVVVSDTGTDATIPLADSTNAGVMSPEAVVQLAGLGSAAEADVADFAPANHTHELLMTTDERTKLTALPAAADLSTSLAGKMSNTMTGLQTVINAGTPAEKAALQASVSEGGLRSGNRLAALIRARQDCAVFMASDSTGDATNEWFYQLGVRMAAAYPQYRVEHRIWNTTNLTYDAVVAISDPAQTPVLAWDDTFTTAGITTFGRKPDRVGGAASNSWSRDGSGTDGDWTISGGKLVRSTDTTTGGLIAGNGIAGAQKLTMQGMTFSTVGDGVGTQIFIAYLHYVDGNNSLMAQIRVSSAGVVTFYIFERTAAVNSPILTVASPASIPGSTAAVTGDLVVTRVGNTVSASFNGTVLGSASMSAGSIAATVGATQFGIAGGNGNLIGMTIDRITCEITPIAPLLQMYNGAAPGQTLAYQITNQAAQLPIAFDAIFINHSHNYGLTTPAQFAGTVRSYVAQLPAAQNYADIIIRSQNPETNPAIYPTQHAARCARIPVLARGEGWGYIGCYEAIVATPGYLSLINTDGIHPLPACSTIEADTAMAWLSRKVG